VQIAQQPMEEITKVTQDTNLNMFNLYV